MVSKKTSNLIRILLQKVVLSDDVDSIEIVHLYPEPYPVVRETEVDCSVDGPVRVENDFP